MLYLSQRLIPDRGCRVRSPFSSVQLSSVAIIEFNFAAVPMPITVTVATAPSWSLCVFTLPKRTFNTAGRLLKTPGTRSSVSLLNYVTHFAYTDTDTLAPPPLVSRYNWQHLRHHSGLLIDWHLRAAIFPSQTIMACMQSGTEGGARP